MQFLIACVPQKENDLLKKHCRRVIEQAVQGAIARIRAIHGFVFQSQDRFGSIGSGSRSIQPHFRVLNWVFNGYKWDLLRNVVKPGLVSVQMTQRVGCPGLRVIDHAEYDGENEEAQQNRPGVVAKIMVFNSNSVSSPVKTVVFKLFNVSQIWPDALF